MGGMEYIVIIHPAEEGGYWTEVPALPGCGSQGETLEETIEMTKDAIKGWVEYLRDKGQTVPEDHDVVVTVTL